MKYYTTLEQGERVIDTRTADEYIFESYDRVSDAFNLINWIGQKSVGASEFYKYFELDLKLPTGTQNKELSLDQDLCNHEYVDYSGLRESFKFCKKCDKRENA